METSSWISTAHRKARYATILTSPLANQMLEEVSRSFVKEWTSVFGSPFPFVCLGQKSSRACPWHRCWVGWNKSLHRSKWLRRSKSSRLSYNLPFSTRRRSKPWSLLWASTNAPNVINMTSSSPPQRQVIFALTEHDVELLGSFHVHTIWLTTSCVDPSMKSPRVRPSQLLFPAMTEACEQRMALVVVIAVAVAVIFLCCDVEC